MERPMDRPMVPVATVRYLCKPIQTDIETDTDILKRYGKVETGVYLYIFLGNTDNRYGKTCVSVWVYLHIF